MIKQRCTGLCKCTPQEACIDKWRGITKQQITAGGVRYFVFFN